MADRPQDPVPWGAMLCTDGAPSCLPYRRCSAMAICESECVCVCGMCVCACVLVRVCACIGLRYVHMAGFVHACRCNRADVCVCVCNSLKKRSVHLAKDNLLFKQPQKPYKHRPSKPRRQARPLGLGVCKSLKKRTVLLANTTSMAYYSSQLQKPYKRRSAQGLIV